jgi:hypothetical protein
MCVTISRGSDWIIEFTAFIATPLEITSNSNATAVSYTS